jgi:glycerophosphoryl diester phosphodiesterase
VPSLAEALAVTVERGRLVNVEVKAGPENRGEVVEAVLAAIRNADALDRTTVSSFDHPIVVEVARREPGLATGALVDGPIDGLAEELLRTLGVDAIHAPPSFIGESVGRMPVLVYTVNDASPGGLAARLAEAGVAGLFTDDPEALASVLGITPSSERTRLRSGIPAHRWAGPSAGPIPPPSR